MDKPENKKDPLVAELTRVSNRRFDMLDERRGSYKPLTGIDELTALAVEFTGDDASLKRWQRIERLIRSATDIIKDRKHEQRIRMLFGLLDDLALLTARALHKNIADSYESRTDPKKIYADNQISLTHLAAAIRSLLLQHRQTMVGRYIRREAYHQRFSEALEAGHRVVEIVGLPGIGKSRLAEALVRERQGPKPVLKIRFSNDVMRVEDLYDALDKWEIPASAEAVSANPTVFLAKLLCGRNSPKLVIFDSLTDASAAWKVLPNDHETVVVITARAASRSATHNCPVIGITRMDEPESVELARSYLPELADRDLLQFARSFHGYPLLLVHAAILLAYRRGSVAQFCNDIKSRVNLLSDNTYTDDGKTLSVVLAEILEIITEQSMTAVEIISLISNLNGQVINSEFIYFYLLEGRKLPVGEVSTSAAFAQLKRFRLIEFQFGIEPNSVDYSVYVHPLVGDIIQSMDCIAQSITREALMNCAFAIHEQSIERVKKRAAASKLAFFDDFTVDHKQVRHDHTGSLEEIYKSLIVASVLSDPSHHVELLLANNRRISIEGSARGPIGIMTVVDESTGEKFDYLTESRFGFFQTESKRKEHPGHLQS